MGQYQLQSIRNHEQNRLCETRVRSKPRKSSKKRKWQKKKQGYEESALYCQNIVQLTAEEKASKMHMQALPALVPSRARLG